MPQYPSEQFKPGQNTPAGRPQRPTPRSLKGHPDIRSTKEYKAAARKWTSTIVALPIVLVTSYMIFERVYGGKEQKRFARPESRDN
ncbi:hypothetical protein N7493_003262 [Penicillium malachiteum]|uniref:Uncharacterized protein n=1 Tax=Penicillium malachiteum TaxID=1324776 RepID=A0AAD6HTF1_9EURO|nr:hypothetical protein N7493_003262 [Penicillium malachiteum]